MNLLPSLFGSRERQVNPFSVVEAKAGYTSTALPMARALPVASGEGRVASEIVKVGETPRSLMQVIRPNVRDRWMATTLRNYTPERVEQVLRGAMAGDLTAQWEMFDLMEQTWPRLSKNLNQIKDSVVAMEWNVQPLAPKNGKPSAEAQKRADLIEELIWSMEPRAVADENDFEGTIRDLLDAKGKGIAVLEVDWMVGDSSYGPALKPRATRWVHPRHYGYPGITGAPDELMLNLHSLYADASYIGGGFVNGLAGQASYADGGPTRTGLDVNGALVEGRFAPFPENKFLVGVWKQKSGHPISGALLRILGFWWTAANFAGEWYLNYAQIFGMPIRWANYDPGLPQADKDILEEMLATMGSAGYAMFPAGVTLELKEASKGASDNPHEGVLRAADKLCDILILRQSLTTDVGERGGGSKALGQVHEDVLGQVIVGAGDWVAARLNAQLIQSMCLLNFGDTKECPWLMPAMVEEADEVAMVQRDVGLAGIGVKFPVDYMHDRYKIPRPGPNDEVLEMPQALAAQASSADGAPTRSGQSKTVQAKAREDARPPEHHAHDEATDKLIEAVSGVEARWLGGLRPYYRELIGLAENAKDEQEFAEKLQEVIAKSNERFPDLFARMDVEFLADRFEGLMGASCVNGAVSGFLKRRNGSRGRSPSQTGGAQ